MTSSLAKRSRRLIEVWRALSDDVTAKILTLAGLRADDFDDVTATEDGEVALR